MLYGDTGTGLNNMSFRPHRRRGQRFLAHAVVLASCSEKLKKLMEQAKALWRSRVLFPTAWCSPLGSHVFGFETCWNSDLIICLPIVSKIRHLFTGSKKIWSTSRAHTSHIFLLGRADLSSFAGIRDIQSGRSDETPLKGKEIDDYQHLSGGSQQDDTGCWG